MNPVALVFVVGSALFDILSNICLTYSKGFRHLKWGVLAIVLIWASFGLIGAAVVHVDVSIAYALWGGIGVLGTALAGRILFGQKLSPIGWLGIVCVVAAILIFTL